MKWRIPTLKTDMWFNIRNITNCSLDPCWPCDLDTTLGRDLPPPHLWCDILSRERQRVWMVWMHNCYHFQRRAWACRVGNIAAPSQAAESKKRQKYVKMMLWQIQTCKLSTLTSGGHIWIWISGFVDFLVLCGIGGQVCQYAIKVMSFFGRGRGRGVGGGDVRDRTAHLAGSRRAPPAR